MVTTIKIVEFIKILMKEISLKNKYILLNSNSMYSLSVVCCVPFQNIKWSFNMFTFKPKFII